jgi:glycine/D-amino acid oxidase-like deaminating enzyme
LPFLERGTIETNIKNLTNTSSGLVGSFKHSAQQVKLGKYSVQLLNDLTKEGFDIGWDQRGSLHLARTHDRMLQFRKMKSQSGPWGISCQLMSKEECKKKCEVIHDEDVKGGLLIHDDGEG